MVFLTVVIDFLRMSSDVYSISDDLQSGNDCWPLCKRIVSYRFLYLTIKVVYDTVPVRFYRFRFYNLEYRNGEKLSKCCFWRAKKGRIFYSVQNRTKLPN